jgi:predicted phosphoadenosine phosphosulfate sulfurtransferase
MQDSNRRIPILPKEKNEDAKRTTIILEKKDRDFIELLISEGKETGIKPLISKMLDIYKSMMVYDWRFPGEYYCGISRIALVNVELFNILTQHIPKEQWLGVGEKMGDALKVSIQSTQGIDASQHENWEKVFERLKVQGFGDFYLKDKFLLLKTPFINDCEIWKGMMENLLSVELEIRTSAPPLVFEIKKRKQP